ncbi:FtsK/SpoIIIE family protein [Streptococcus infantarius subsp. infantarius]|nr:FtsK/SpoIIIE family protein [Streptococcus infantarius subsp. infantarius]
MLLPFLIGNGYYAYMSYQGIIITPFPYLIKFSITLLLPAFILLGLHHLCYQKLLFFKRLNTLRILANFLVENRYYLSKTIKRDGRSMEKIILPKVFVKQTNYHLLISFILEGNKFQDRFINLGSTLEVMFNGDFKNKTFDDRFIQYDISINRIDSRIDISEVTINNHSLKLMADVFWDYIAEPHLLIGGGTGGGKTVVLMSIVWALAKVGFIDLCDPKNADLAGLKGVPVFHGRVFSTKEEIIQCLKDNVTFMENRYQAIQNHPNYKIGKSFSDYGMKPKFIVIDEWAALMAKIDSDYRLQAEVTEYLTQLVLEGRQSGVFIIFAMQRPDGEYIKTALRDNFMKRLSVGHLEDTGYTMMFGDANRNKEFKKLDKINGKTVKGRGYIASNGELAGEFFSPYVPFDKGFSFYEAFMKLPVLKMEGEEFEVFDIKQTPQQEEKPKIEQTSTKLLSDFAKEKELPLKTLRKLAYLFDERGMTFDKEGKSLVVTPDQEKLLLEALETYNGGCSSYARAVEMCLSSHGLEQEQGQA